MRWNLVVSTWMRCDEKLSVAEYCGQRMYETLAIVALVTRHCSVERHDTAAYWLCSLVAGQFYVYCKGPGSPFVASAMASLPVTRRFVGLDIFIPASALRMSVCRNLHYGAAQLQAAGGDKLLGATPRSLHSVPKYAQHGTRPPGEQNGWSLSILLLSHAIRAPTNQPV